jgi:hypothetical protein
MLGEFGDNSCSLQVDIAGGKDDKTKLFVYLYYTATVMIVGKSVTLVYHMLNK